MQRSDRFSLATRIIVLGFIANTVLMISKLLVGYYAHSDAVFADGLESACDFFALSSSMVALRFGKEPLDEQHPYGHGRAESIAALFIGLLIVITGLMIVVSGANHVLAPPAERPLPIALVITAMTIIAKWYLYRTTEHASKRLDSPAVRAVADDHKKDALTSLATFGGVLGALLGWSVLDPLAAAITGVLIVIMGGRTIKDAVHDLLDGSVDRALIDAIAQATSLIPGVLVVRDIRGRRSGQFVLIDLKIDMAADMTVRQAHDVMTEVRHQLFERFTTLGDVMIHVNPHDDEHIDFTRL